MEGRMKLSDFVVREAILVDLQATGKEEAIREMVGSLHKAGQLADGDVESVIRAILGREELGSTGIGRAWPCRTPGIRRSTRLIGTVALSRRGVDFAALDGEPVDIFFLLVSPPNQPGDHLRALENISRHLKDERFVSFLRQAKTREDVVEVLEEADQNRRDGNASMALDRPVAFGPGLRGRVIPRWTFPAEPAVGPRFRGPCRRVPSRATTMLLITSPVVPGVCPGASRSRGLPIPCKDSRPPVCPIEIPDHARWSLVPGPGRSSRR